MRMANLCHRLVRDRRGAMAMITALSMPVLIGGVGLAADTIQWTYMKRAMQRQADSAALAGAFAMSQQNVISTTVTADLARNNNVLLTVTPVIQSPPTAGAYSGDARAVRVALATDVRLPFVGFVMGGPIRIPAEATAKVISQGQYCVLALETLNTTGVTINGNTTLDFGCGIMSNSPSASSVTAGGSSVINATPIAAVGGVPTSNNYAAGTQLIPYSVPQFDPLAALPTPDIRNSSNNGNVNPNQVRDLVPGNYSGMDIKGTANFAPGIYYIDGGQFSLGSQAIINGTGVTIILTSKNTADSPSTIATADINGTAQVNLTAPTSGTYAGVLFYQDRRALDNATNKFNGTSNSKYQGAIYFPKQQLRFNGTAGMDIKCMQLIGRRVDFIGDSSITNVCPANSGASSFSGTRVKLVA